MWNFQALEKYRYEQSLEHTSQFIEKLEKELEEYNQHLAKFKKGKEDTIKDVTVGTVVCYYNQYKLCLIRNKNFIRNS